MATLIRRRTILLTGVAAGSALALGTGARWVNRPALGAAVLSRTELDIVEAVGRVLFPHRIFLVSGGDAETSKEVDRILAEVIEPNAVSPFRSMLAALEWGTLVSRGTRFSKLNETEAQHVLEVWGSENPFPRRVAFDSLQAIIGMAFFRRKQVLEAMDWRTECLE